MTSIFGKRHTVTGLVVEVCISFALLGILLVCCRPVKTGPDLLKVADCTNMFLQFKLSITNNPRYHFLIAMPPGVRERLEFRGEIRLTQNNGHVASIPISSRDVINCNWLTGFDSYVLTWSRTNRGESLAEFMIKDQTYDVTVEFSEKPPLVSSLWFVSMKRIRTLSP